MRRSLYYAPCLFAFLIQPLPAVGQQAADLETQPVAVQQMDLNTARFAGTAQEFFRARQSRSDDAMLPAPLRSDWSNNGMTSQDCGCRASEA